MQGEKSRLETEASFSVEFLEELTRTVLSGEKDPELSGRLFGGTLAAVGPIDGNSSHCIWSNQVKAQFRNF